jgi:hypothetical protein
MMLVGVIVPVMVMAGVGWPLAAVGAALWLERADHRMHMGAKANHHRLKNVIRLNVDRVGRDFRRCVAIAEMPRDPGERVCIGGMNLHERLGGSNDADEGSVLELQGVTVGKIGRLGKVKQNGPAAVSGHRNAAAVARRPVEGDAVDNRLGADLGFPDDAGGTLHRVAPQNRK